MIMYQPAWDSLQKHPTPQWEYHVKTYGGPEKFGWKDFIPMFTAEKFDPDEWAELFKASGALYAGPVGTHHDGFSMWDKYNEWNALKMGPKPDGTLPDEIKSVRMLGVDQELEWKLTSEALVIKVPDQKPCEHAYVFKIIRDQPYP